MELGSGAEEEREQVRGEEHVAQFAHTMMDKLAANEHKGGYEGEDPMWLLDRLEEEVTELRRCFEGGPETQQPDDLARWHIEKRKEAADVGNFAMMLSLDAYRSLEYCAEHQGSSVADGELAAEWFIRAYDGTREAK